MEKVVEKAFQLPVGINSQARSRLEIESLV